MALHGISGRRAPAIGRWVGVALTLSLLASEFLAPGPALAESGRIVCLVVDGVGGSHPVPCTVFDSDFTEIARTTAMVSEVAVPSGHYTVSPEFDPLAFEQVQVTEGDVVAVSFERPEALWLQHLPGNADGTEPLLVEFKSQPAMGEVLDRYRMLDAWRNILSVPRPWVAPEVVDDALRAARTWFDDRPDKNELSDAQRHWYWATDRLAWLIFASVGAEADGERIGVGAVQGLMDLRRGALRDGRLMSKARDGDLWSAAALASYGIDVDAQPLVARLAADDESDWPRSLFEALAHRPSASMLAATRQTVERSVSARSRYVAAKQAGEETKDIPVQRYEAGLEFAAAVLLAHGDDDDRRLLAQAALNRRHLEFLIPFAADPRPLLTVSMDELWNFWSAPAVVHRLRPFAPEDQNAFLDHARAAYIVRAVKTFADPAAPGDTRQQDLDYGRYFDFLTSNFRPNERTAAWWLRGLVHYGVDINIDWRWGGTRWTLTPDQLVHAGQEFFTEMPWCPEPEALDLYVAQLRERPHFPWQFNHVDHDDLVAALAPLRSDGEPEAHFVDLALALHAVAFIPRPPAYGDFPDGIEREAYMFRRLEENPSYGGVLSGVLEVRPAWASGRLVLGLHIDQVAHSYDGVGGLATMIAKNQGDPAEWDHHAYTVDDGRKLVAGVWLRGPQGSTALQREGVDADGFELYSAAMERLDLDGRYLDVRFEFLEQGRDFVFDLGLSDFARHARRSGLGAEPASAREGGRESTAESEGAREPAPGSPEAETPR